MLPRYSRGLFSAVIVLAVVGLPVFAIQASNLQPLAGDRAGEDAQVAPAAPLAPVELPPAATDAEDEEAGERGCRGLQMAFWRLETNPGRGEGKETALEEIEAKAAERGCELSLSAPEWWRGKGPSWLREGDGPPWGNAWGRTKDKTGEDADADGEGRGGPPWAGEGDGPPRGMGWGRLIEQAPEDACERIAARLEQKPNARIPEDLRQRIIDELGCALPE